MDNKITSTAPKNPIIHGYLMPTCSVYTTTRAAIGMVKGGASGPVSCARGDGEWMYEREG
jgi:hypothetical protein